MLGSIVHVTIFVDVLTSALAATLKEGLSPRADAIVNAAVVKFVKSNADPSEFLGRITN
jgi:hypothetical protein